MRSVDINCDMGESFGAWRTGDDDALLPHITSANVACGFHAGDPSVMRRTVRTAAEHGVAVGAHPGFPDLAGFGRRRMDIAPDALYDLVVYQIGALLGHCRAAGVPLVHVKPHGALYNMAAADAGVADVIAAAVRDVDPRLVLFGLAGGELLGAAERAGLRGASEVFADRAYEPDGSLTPRGRPDATIGDPAAAAARVLRMVAHGVVETTAGTQLPVRAETICVHGDGTHAAAIARAVRVALEREGFPVHPLRDAH